MPHDKALVRSFKAMRKQNITTASMLTFRIQRTEWVTCGHYSGYLCGFVISLL